MLGLLLCRGNIYYNHSLFQSSLAISFLQKNPEQFGLPAKYQIFCFQGDAFFYTGEFHAASVSAFVFYFVCAG